MRPLIGITTTRAPGPAESPHAERYASPPAYAAMVEQAGGIPVLLVPTPAVEEVLDRIDGLLLAGGGDVDPTRYGGTRHESVYGVDPDRDEFEIALARGAAGRRMPTLCICRGLQVMNVAFHGTLIEDIVTESPDHLLHAVETHDGDRPAHPVAIGAGTTTAKVLGTTELEVNSLHHQAIRQLGDGLVVTATAPDGIIEAIAPADDAWPMWGVQWHPERLGAGDPPSLALFAALVEAAH